MSPILNPTGKYSFITERLAIGGVVAYGEDLSGRFHFAINVAEELERACPGVPTTDILSMHCGFDDTHKIGPELAKIERAVGHVLAHRNRGETVLVTCAQGRNRSALVVAETLIRGGADPEFVVRTIRERRANALTNTTFVAWLMRKR